MSGEPNSDGGAAAVASDHVVFTDLDGVEGVLVDLNTRQYFTLNETACLVWRGIARGRSLAEIALEMSELYDVTPEQATVSARSALAELAALRLIALRQSEDQV